MSKQNRLVNALLDTPWPTGGDRYELMTEGQVKRRAGQTRAGLLIQFRRHVTSQWTSAQAKQASAKSKSKRARNGRILGRRAKYHPAVRRAPLRAQYATCPGVVSVAGLTLILRYVPTANFWWQTWDEGGLSLRVSERTALRRLGHMPKIYRSTTGAPVRYRALPAPTRDRILPTSDHRPQVITVLRLPGKCDGVGSGG